MFPWNCCLRSTTRSGLNVSLLVPDIFVEVHRGKMSESRFLENRLCTVHQGLLLCGLLQWRVAGDSCEMHPAIIAERRSLRVHLFLLPLAN